jgi:hypothetical protein
MKLIEHSHKLKEKLIWGKKCSLGQMTMIFEYLKIPQNTFRSSNKNSKNILKKGKTGARRRDRKIARVRKGVDVTKEHCTHVWKWQDEASYFAQYVQIKIKAKNKEFNTG